MNVGFVVVMLHVDYLAGHPCVPLGLAYIMILRYCIYFVPLCLFPNRNKVLLKIIIILFHILFPFIISYRLNHSV